jgi:Fe-S-cluster containining protein
LPARRLNPKEKFAFGCHSQLACYNRCCHNLNLFLYPYDVLRLRQALCLEADQIIERHVDIVLRHGHHFPEVLLRMSDRSDKPCIFLSEAGCTVYADRPHTCRYFPVERGIFFNATAQRSVPVHFFRPPDFCQGPTQDQLWTIESYARHQQATIFDRMTAAWADICHLFQENPWGSEGPQGAKAKMVFMAAYNLDRFRQFVFDSTFLQRYRVPSLLVSKMRKNDEELLLFGFAWIRFLVGGKPVRSIQPR